MIQIVFEKIIRYLKMETQWRVSILIFLMALSVVYLELDILKKKQSKIKDLRRQAEEVRLLPQMQRELKARNKNRNAQRKAEEEARRVEKEKMFLEMMREKERLAQLETQLEEVVEKEVVPVLEGVGLINGAMAALIEGEIYTEGQVVGEYLVKAVSLEQVILQHVQTKEIYTLMVNEPLDGVK